jgi:hypothetical protein
MELGLSLPAAHFSLHAPALGCPRMRFLFVIAVIVHACGLLSPAWAQTESAPALEPSAKVQVAEKEANDRRLFQQFHKKLYPLLTHPEKGCVDCHSSEGTSNLVLTGNSTDDFHTLLDEQYLKFQGVDTLLNRVATAHGDRRMPKDATPWSSREIQKLRAFVHAVEDVELQSGVRADEQFPRSLLSPFRGEKPADTENQFLTYRQLQGKIRVMFEDDWVRNGRDLFSENLALFGGADFKTRFNETSQASASYLVALEMLARDVSNRAYELKLGPFHDWRSLDPDALRQLHESESITIARVNAPASTEVPPSQRACLDAIDRLYQHILLRSPTSAERKDALDLLSNVYALSESIQSRDDELAFELNVKDVLTGLEERTLVRVPVRGDAIQVKQWIVDQSGVFTDESNKALTESAAAPSGVTSTLPAALSSTVLAEHVYLDATVHQRLVIHNLGTIRNVSFAGLEIQDDQGSVVQKIDIDSPLVQVEGAWQIDDQSRVRSYEDRAQNKGESLIRIALQAIQPGEFKLVLKWRKNKANADNVLVELFSSRAGNQLEPCSLPQIPALGQAQFFYDCSNDTEPYASPAGVFRFDDQLGHVLISNQNTLDTVTAASVAFVSNRGKDPAFMIDSKEAEGSSQWKTFDAGRFKAYNVKGALLHDDNARKGELTLKYAPREKRDQGWKPDEFYRVRVYFPGKKDQEVQVPVVVHAQQSSPIVRVASPRLAKADCSCTLDASASYTVQHSSLEFRWKQIAGTRVSIPDPTAAKITFATPRRSIEQAAWTALCSALLRHPDFLFTRPPSLNSAEDDATKDRLRLMKLSLDLVGRPPTRSELHELANGVSLEAFADRFLDSREFRDFYFHRIRLNLESQGTEVQDEPVRLWSYIAFNDRPFTELLTADYTVDKEMKRADRPAYHGRTGILTTPGFIQGKPGLPHYNYAAQVSMLFLGFVYEVPAEIVELREGVTALGTTDPNSVCYSCHKILTPLAFQRLNWTDEGKFRTQDESGQPIDASDQNASIDYPFPGKGMEAFATQAVKKERFVRTILNTHFHFYFGRPMRFREDERVLYKRLWDNVQQNDFKIRSLIRAIVTSPEYLH